MKREASAEDEFEQQQQHKQRRLERIRNDLLSRLREYGQGGVFMEVVKYLSIEDAYKLSILDETINLYFHAHGVWYDYAKDYLWRTYKVTPEKAIERTAAKLPRNPVNYLWVVAIYEKIRRYHDNFVMVSPSTGITFDVKWDRTGTILVAPRTLLGTATKGLCDKISRNLFQNGITERAYNSYYCTFLISEDYGLFSVIYAMLESGLWLDFGGRNNTLIRSQI